MSGNKNYEQHMIEKMNICGFKEKPQRVYAAIDTEQYVRRGSDASSWHEDGLLIRFSLMNDEMIAQERRLNRRFGEESGPLSLNEEYQCYLFTFDLFVPGSNTDLLAKFMKLRSVTVKGSEAEEGKKGAADTEEYPVASSSYFECILATDPVANSMCFPGTVSLSVSPYYDSEVYLCVCAGEAEIASCPDSRLFSELRNCNLVALCDEALSSIADTAGIMSVMAGVLPCAPPAELDCFTCSVMKSLNSLCGLSAASERNCFARVYNVGQANMIAIGEGIKLSEDSRKFHTPAFFFDVGKPCGYIAAQTDPSFRKFVEESINSAKTVRPVAVVISHWHFDHYSAASQLLNLADGAFDPDVWLIPPGTVPKSFLSVFRKIREKKLVLVVDGPMVISDSLSIWKGTGEKSLNDGSLLLLVGDTVFAGDCDYEFWPEGLVAQLGRVKNMAVPHHGARMNTALLSKWPKNARGKAVCSVGRAFSDGTKPYGHPNDEHMANLAHTGFDLRYTSKLGKCHHTMIEIQE